MHHGLCHRDLVVRAARVRHDDDAPGQAGGDAPKTFPTGATGALIEIVTAGKASGDGFDLFDLGKGQHRLSCTLERYHNVACHATRDFGGKPPKGIRKRTDISSSSS